MDAQLERTSRYDFPLPEGAAALRLRILWLMLDGMRRSREEIQDALNTRKEVTSRIRELRTMGFPFNSPRSEGSGPSDNVYRYVLCHARIIAGLLELYSDHVESVSTWLTLPHPQLGGETAREVIAKGEHERVWRIVEGLRSGAHA